MPWQESTVVDERARFSKAYLTGAFQMSELCALYHVSRPTGYRWVARYEQGGRAALVDRSRAPHHCPHRMNEEVQAWFIKARKRYGWGARKLLKIYGHQRPRGASPSRTAVSNLFKRAGLSQRRRRRVPRTCRGGPRQPVSRPNQLWTIDFKGQFRTDDHRWCYPLTLADQHARYLLLCHGQLDCSAHPAQERIERVFREFRLARVHPFGQRQPVRLSGDRRVVADVGAVGEIGYWHRALASGVPAGQWCARAHAPNPQGEHRPSPRPEPSHPATPLQCVQARVQRGATA
jgi:transposase